MRYTLFISIFTAICMSWAEHRPQEAPKPETRKIIKPGPFIGDLKLADVRPFTDTTRPPPTQQEIFKLWADASILHLSERFEVPAPSWIFAGKATSLDCQGKIYDAATSTIKVFELMPDGTKWSADQMRYIFMHGFLHHLYAVRGVAYLPGHEPEFERWMKVLGLWRR